MTYPIIETCPVCAHTLHVSKLTCHHCETVIENDFALSKFSNFSKAQIEFIEVFLLKRGNIKEVEKVLRITYETVRSKVNEIVAQLGQHEDKEKRTEGNAATIIEMLDHDEIRPQEAIALLNKTRSDES